MNKIDFSKPCHVHFIGIGGISMSALAEILLNAGFKISGSDGHTSEITEKLCSLGAVINTPQSADNVSSDIDVVVYTAAIHPDNPEFARCVELGLPMQTRAELLGQMMEGYKESIAVAGTHGKTTTTSMISEILLAAAVDPTILVGGILDAIKSNVRVGDSKYFITEACEYTNSYHSFFPKYNVILNVEADHLDFFKNLENVRASFKQYANNTSADGILVINHDVDDLAYFTEGLKCEVATFGTGSDATAYPKDISYEDGCASFVPVLYGEEFPRISLSVPGSHNITNALAALLIANKMGLPKDAMVQGLKAFGGARRRFERKGIYNGAIVIDDYAHHPTEISASLKAARNYKPNRLIVVFQPHTYTRTLSFLDDFAMALSCADIVILADIYPAREPDIYGVSSADIAKAMEKYKSSDVHYLGSFEACEKFISKILLNNDMLITMGAGDVNLIGEHLLSE